jgi:phytoene synthase
MDNDIEAEVRRADPDRWLASRLISDAAMRSDVLAVLALDAELARVRVVVSEALLGEIRLTWWQEALDEITQQRPVRRHPTVQTLAQAIGAHGLSPVLLSSLIEARIEVLDGAVFDDPDKVLVHIDNTSVALSALILQILSPSTDLHSVQAVSRAYGLARLRLAGRLTPELAVDWAPQRIRDDLALGAQALKAVPVAAFPAIAHCALTKSLAKGREPGPLAKRALIFWASLTGRV